jgi:hypothetical protein
MCAERKPGRSSQRSSWHLNRGSEVKKHVIFGWSIYFAGLAIWLYGYFTTGHPSFIDWHAYTPRWIADFIPNMESEIGMALMFASMVPMYWPHRS